MSRVIPEKNAKAGAAGKGGVLANIPALGGWPVTEKSSSVWLRRPSLGSRGQG